MSTLALDTHKAVKTLREAGFEEAQAEAMVTTFGNAMSENVATKADIGELKAYIAEMKADVDALKADVATLKTDMLALEQRLTVRLYTTILTGIGLMVAANGIMLAAFKLF
ncbi:MAG: hypothetical protein OXB94_06695 [Nitrospira sp.]|nr:hypothetical protein [Nitrospira sp.]